MNLKDNCLNEKIKNVIGFMKDELGGKLMTEFAVFRPKPYSFLTDMGDENKIAKGTKKCVIKRKIKFEDYKNCLEATRLESEINYLEKSKLDVDNLIKNHKELTKNNNLIFESQQRVRSEKRNVFTTEVKKIALNAKR